MRFILLGLFAATAFAADPAGFSLWKANELKDLGKALDSQLGPDHAARATLGDYGNHSVRLLHRVADGTPEMHDEFSDIFIILGGEGIVVVGGTIANVKSLVGGRGEYTGTGIDGGENHAISAGDVIHIPVKAPHEILVPKGKEITYIRVAIPDK